MRGRRQPQRELTYLIDLESMVGPKHPIREVKRMCEEVLKEMDPLFNEMYSEYGRMSIPPERLLMSWVLMALFSVRSCRLFAEQLKYNMLFKWFLDMNPDEIQFDASTFSKNMERFQKHRVSETFFIEVVYLADRHKWISHEHFSVDGTLIESWASMKSFRPKDEEPPPRGKGRNGWEDFKDQKRSNDTHASTTDPESKLVRKSKGKEAKLSFRGHSVIENRNGLLVHFTVRPAVGEDCTEAEVADGQLDEITQRGLNPKTVGGDKGYHTKEFVKNCRDRGTVPHVAEQKGRKTPAPGLDKRTTGSEAYKTSQRIRKRVEEPFGWMKTVGLFRKSRWIGVERTDFVGQFIAASCNLIHMAKLTTTNTSDPPCIGSAATPSAV